MMGELLGHSTSVILRREDYEASASLAWTQTHQFESMAKRASEFLHREELEIFRALKVERRQISYLLGRYTAKSALQKCVGSDFEPTLVPIVSGIFNQPVVHGVTARPLGVSISHSDRLVCSLAYPEEHPMAIDVEEIDEARTKVMMTQIGQDEAALAQSVCESPDVAATVVWTAKEALSKALRCGMTCPYELLEICKLEVGDGFYTGRFRNFGQYKFQSWRMAQSVVTIVLPKRTEMVFSFPDSL
jgi:4'-phosphopantetheinyl transferase